MLPEAQASHRGVLPSMLRASTLWEEETSVRASVGVGGGDPRDPLSPPDAQSSLQRPFLEAPVSQRAAPGKGVQGQRNGGWECLLACQVREASSSGLFSQDRLNSASLLPPAPHPTHTQTAS